MTDNLTQHRVNAVTNGACDEWRYSNRPKRLPLSVDMQPGETATSLGSRMPAINGLTGMRTLCRDFGITYVDLCNGLPDAVIRVAELAGADPELLLLHTPRLIEPGWHQLRREQLKFTALLPNGGQICPVCIAEDECRDPQCGPYQRDIWQIAALRHCRKHGVAYERPKFGCRASDAYDFLRALKTWSPTGIVHVGADHTELEDYLLQRLQLGPGDRWIDRQAFHVVWQFAEALGTLLTRGPKAKAVEQPVPALIRAGCVGFQIMRAGPETIRKVFADLRDEAGQNRDAYGKIYGAVLSCLLDRREDPDFDELRHLLRSFILDNFLIPAGTLILGEPCNDARVFTSLTASKHFDVPLSLLTRQMRHEGLLRTSQRNEKSDPSLLLSRHRMEAIVVQVQKLSSISVTRAVLGADHHVMDRLCAAGLLMPHFGNDGGMPMYHHGEVMRFLARLLHAVMSVRKPSRYWKPITSAAVRSHCSTVWIIQKVLDGKLKLSARLPNPFQLCEFLVPMNAVKVLLQGEPESLASATEAANWLAVDVRTIHALAIDGYLPFQLAACGSVKKPSRMFRTSDLETFAHDYIALRALSGQRKALYTATLDFIAEQGVAPLPIREGMRPIFERRAIERIARMEGGEQLARLIEVEETRPDRLSVPVSRPGEGETGEDPK